MGYCFLVTLWSVFCHAGNQSPPVCALVNVSLEELVPKDHFYRHLERSLDLPFVRELVQPCNAAGGRPSVDPKYLCGIRRADRLPVCKRKLARNAKILSVGVVDLAT